MATALPSPPESRSSTPSPEPEKDTGTGTDTDTLTQRLDDLLEQYLTLLDQYTTLREDLSQSFSSGFFSLAHAQRASTLGAGRRYGQERYDDRMKAQKTVKITGGESGERNIIYKVVKRTPPATQHEDAGPAAETSQTAEHVAEDPKEDNKTGPEEEQSNPTQGRNKQSPATRDPITWFGILVPPALRQAQSHFSRAVGAQIPDLLSIEADMRRVEDQIWSARAELGIMHEYEDHQEADVEAEEQEELDVVEKMEERAIQPAKTQANKSQPSRRQLPARPAHAKAHLLKLGE